MNSCDLSMNCNKRQDELDCVGGICFPGVLSLRLWNVGHKPTKNQDLSSTYSKLLWCRNTWPGFSSHCVIQKCSPIVLSSDPTIPFSIFIVFLCRLSLVLLFHLHLSPCITAVLTKVRTSLYQSDDRWQQRTCREETATERAHDRWFTVVDLIYVSLANRFLTWGMPVEKNYKCSFIPLYTITPIITYLPHSHHYPDNLVMDTQLCSS